MQLSEKFEENQSINNQKKKKTAEESIYFSWNLESFFDFERFETLVKGRIRKTLKLRNKLYVKYFFLIL